MLLDSLGDFEDMPPWSEAADQLLNAGLTINPSTLHGAIVGLLGAGFDPDADNAIVTLEKALAVDLQGDLVDFITRILRATLSAILDSDYAFHPLLPDDDDEFDERVTSTSDWASGFLTGFTQAVSATASADATVPPDTAEALKDFAAIAQVDPEQVESEEAERDLEELIEYLRFAALNVVQDAISYKE